MLHLKLMHPCNDLFSPAYQVKNCKHCCFHYQVEQEIRKKGWEYMWNEHLGYVLTCPSNLGTGMRAGVHIKIPNLCKV